MVSSMRASSEQASEPRVVPAGLVWSIMLLWADMFAGKQSSGAAKTGNQTSRQAGKSRAGGGEERRGEGGRGGEEESRLGGINDPWVCYLMSSSGDANSTVEQLDGLLGS